jgi:hypothetical protein
MGWNVAFVERVLSPDPCETHPQLTPGQSADRASTQRHHPSLGTGFELDADFQVLAGI